MELIAYYRVADARQAKGGPQLEAQRAAVERLRVELERRRDVAVLIGGFIEIEPSPHRPQLARALAAARKRGAVVVVAQLRRLGSDADLLDRLQLEADLSLAKAAQGGGGFGGFLFAGLPAAFAFENPDSLRWVLTLTASLARLDRDNEAQRNQRIRDGLAAAKASGVKLGGLRPGTLRENARAKEAAASRSEALRPILAPLAAEGASFGAMALALYDAGTRTAKGEALSRSAVKRHLQRLGLIV